MLHTGMCCGSHHSSYVWLQAAGTKGKRYCMPNARIMMHSPAGESSSWHAEPVLVLYFEAVTCSLACHAPSMGDLMLVGAALPPSQ